MKRHDLLLGTEVPFIVLDNFYDEKELQLIWEELEFLNSPEKLLLPEESGSAKTKDGKILKSNRSLFLDSVWNNNRNLSNILTVNRKIFSDDMKVLKESPSWFFQCFRCERDHTMISFYENCDYYQPHRDESSVTILHWFFREPKKFEGGDFILHYKEGEYCLNIKNNRSIIFPSFIKHEVTKILMQEEHLNQKLGRYCISQFLHVK